MGNPQLRHSRVTFQPVPIAGIGVGLGSDRGGHTTVLAKGDHPDQPTMNPTMIHFDKCMLVVNHQATGRCQMGMLAIPFLDPVNPASGIHVNMQWGDPSNMVIASITIEDLERVIASMQASLDLAKLEQKARAAG